MVAGVVLASALGALRPVRAGLLVAIGGFLALVVAEQGLAGLVMLGRRLVGEALDHRVLTLGLLAGAFAVSAVGRRYGPGRR